MRNRNPLCSVCYLLPVTFLTLCLICGDRAKAQDWSHFVRTAGHGLQLDNISATIKDANSTYLYGIEVDNDIPGRYESFLDPTEKLRAIKAMADSAHAINNHAFVYIAGLEIITGNADTAQHTFFKDHPDWVQRNSKGEPAIFGGGEAFWITKGDEDAWISPYALEWRKIYMERIRQMTATGIDGIYIDIPYWMGHFKGWQGNWASFDKYTVAAFKKKTGINALKQVKIGDWNDPNFISWVNFRENSISEFASEVKENMMSVNPECKLILEIYPGLSEAVARIGTDNYQLYKIADVIAHEYSPRDKDYVDGGGGNSARSNPLGLMRYMIAMHSFRAMAEDKATWMLSYSWEAEEKINPSDAMKTLFVSQVMSGTNSWDAAKHVMSGSNDYDTRTQVYKWIKENEKIIYSKREPMSSVGVYFSPRTRDYFSDSWERSYFGTMELLMQKGIEFEIVTPSTLDKFKSGLLIFPDVKSLGEEELGQIETILKQGKKHIVFTGHTGEYDSVRKKVEKDRIKSVAQGYKENVTYIKDDPGSDFGNFMEWGYDVAMYNDKELQYQSSKSYEELENTLDKYYLPSVEIKNAVGCVSQITSVNGKPTVYIANFTGLRSKENAIPIPRREVSITFNHLPDKGTVVSFIPFLGKSVQLKGVWNENNLTVALPSFLNGAIVTLNN
ncbi:MAG: alpha-amylase family protein [Flavitalea sp.]